MDDKQKKVVRISTPEEIEAAKASIPRKLKRVELLEWLRQQLEMHKRSLVDAQERHEREQLRKGYSGVYKVVIEYHKFNIKNISDMIEKYKPRPQG